MDVAVLATPRVPRTHALVQQGKMLVIRHASTSNSRAARNDSTVRSGAPQGQEGLPLSGPAGYLAAMLQRAFSTGFIAPCLPTKTHTLPSDSQWLHEIKHDGFRVIARKDGDRVRLYSRPGNDLTRRFPLIAEALMRGRFTFKALSLRTEL